MCRLIESICIENRELQHIELHNERINRSGKILYGWKNSIDLREYIFIPKDLSNERYKCRIETEGEIFTVKIDPYFQRKIETLKVVHFNEIDYTHKTTNRQLLDKAFQLRGDADDIIIVKNGCLTDASAANLLLFDGTHWFTPDTPLLKGTQREYLLRNGRISEKKITIDDLKTFEKVKLVNALIKFEQSVNIDVRNNILNS